MTKTKHAATHISARHVDVDWVRLESTGLDWCVLIPAPAIMYKPKQFLSRHCESDWGRIDSTLGDYWVLSTSQVIPHTFVLFGQDSEARAEENKGNDNEVTDTQPVVKSARTPAVLGRFAFLSFSPPTKESTVEYYTRFQDSRTLFTSVSDSARSAVQYLLTTTAFNTVRHLETETGKNLHNPYFVTMQV